MVFGEALGPRREPFATVGAGFDYQFIANPGYNFVRGPVSIGSLRLHVQFQERCRVTRFPKDSVQLILGFEKGDLLQHE
jgi:hypothetical protein